MTAYHRGHSVGRSFCGINARRIFELAVRACALRAVPFVCPPSFAVRTRAVPCAESTVILVILVMCLVCCV